MKNSKQAGTKHVARWPLVLDEEGDVCICYKVGQAGSGSSAPPHPRPEKQEVPLPLQSHVRDPFPGPQDPRLSALEPSFCAHCSGLYKGLLYTSYLMSFRYLIPGI
jgi:hypothetical protein